ncbi:MAG: glycosyltransferase [Actinobacteria bacterium]|nr:glycosyltransferase [Actinomycetota bacterium]
MMRGLRGRYSLDRMRILLWHGYLLSGTGSNLYAANVAKSWRSSGHDVLVLCQDRRAGDLEFVDVAGDFAPSNDDAAFPLAAASIEGGRCRVVRPAIGRVLPVYVFDEYEGFTAKLFVDLTDAELAVYTDGNVRAMTAAIRAFAPDAIITGHEVMGPYIARQACAVTGTSYLAKLHGSALEYAVKLQDRYLRYAIEGLSGASVVVGGSRYMVQAAGAVIPGWEDKAVVVNPGCDIALFKPIEDRHWEQRLVGYVGKFIPAKGVHHLLAALGLTRASGISGVVVGFGGFEQGLQELWSAFREGDFERVRAVAQRGDGHQPLTELLQWLDSLEPKPRRAFSERITNVALEWPGRLEHRPLARVLPRWTVLVAPSVVPEAFGMVAAEAAACGVFPIVPRHSGIGEIAAALEDVLERPGLLSFDPSDPIEGLAAAIDKVLSLPVAEAAQARAAIVAVARELWSWDRAARRLVELATQENSGKG